VITSPGPGSTVNGTAGDDTINASQGPDVLTGGAGADAFVWAAQPWSPAHVTDFAVGTDRLDLSKLFQAYHYAGSDPVADKVVWLIDDGDGGTKVLFDSDGTGPNPQWPNYIIDLEHVPVAGLTWAQLATGGASGPPAASIALATTSVSHAEGDTGATAFSFTVVRSGDTSGSSTVNWSVAGSGAHPTSGTDFSPSLFPSGQLAFAAGETSKTIQVDVAGDTAVETDETFTLTLSNPNGASLGSAVTATGAVLDDDGSSPPPASGQVLTSSRYGDTLSGGAGDDTLNAGQGPDQLTGAGGADRFVFGQTPWNAGHVTDFTPGTDLLDLRGLLGAYSGSDPVADHWVEFKADGAGGTQVYVDVDGAGGDWPFLITTLDHVAPTQIGAGDWVFR
jgi:hypothetical protein